jgi:hypothetical protein
MHAVEVPLSHDDHSVAVTQDHVARCYANAAHDDGQPHRSGA